MMYIVPCYFDTIIFSRVPQHSETIYIACMEITFLPADLLSVEIDVFRLTGFLEMSKWQYTANKGHAWCPINNEMVIKKQWELVDVHTKLAAVEFQQATALA